VTKAVLPGVAIAAAFLLFGAVYFLTPSLQGDQDVVADDVRRQVEEARRLLDKVGENEERLATVLEGLRLAGVEEPDDELTRDLVEEDRELLVDAEDRLRSILRDLGTRRDDLHQRLERAGGEPAPDQRRSFGAGADQMVSAIREGLAARDRLLQENDQLLQQALEAVNRAKQIQRGQAGGADHPIVLRTEGMVLYSLGSAAYRQAHGARERARAWRSELAATLAALDQQSEPTRLVETSGIEPRIEEARENRQQAAAVLQELRDRLAALRRTVLDLETRLAKQQTIADHARDALDKMSAAGLDFADARGLQRFSAMYAAQSKEYREALRRAHVLEFGILDNAVIDASGDFLIGEYVPADGSGTVSPRRGLYHYRAELVELEKQAAAAQEVLDSLDEKIEAMQASRDRLAQRAEEAVTRAAALREAVAGTYDRLTELLAEAGEHEEVAVAKLTRAVTAFRTAEQKGQALGREASEAASAAGPSSGPSPQSILADDRWTPASSRARAADAELRLAMLRYEQYRDLNRDTAVLNEAQRLGVEVDQDPEVLAEAAELAHQEGLAAAQSAVDNLLRAGRDMNQHYSITAGIAAGYYLQSLFGLPELLPVAVRNYEAAIEGREDSPFVRTYVERSQQLRKRK